MENIEKMIEIHKLYYELLSIPELKYFDTNSEELLDDKLEVLKALKAGKQIKDIPKFYAVLELMPKTGTWDL